MPSYTLNQSQRKELKSTLVRSYKAENSLRPDDVEALMVMYDIPTNQIDPHKIIQDFTNSVQAWKKLSKNEGLSEVDIKNTFNFLNQLDNDQKMQLVDQFNNQNLGSP